MIRCRLCPSRKQPILGEGPERVRVMFIGEAPGKEEDRRRDRDGTGHPFIGDSGKELRHHYLRLAGLKDSEVYITNTVKCIPDESGGNPGPDLARCCSDEFVPREIRYRQPEVIVTLGAVACRTLFPGVDLERNHGLPILAKYRDWEGTLVPMYHPAAGLRDGRIMHMIDAGFVALGEYLRGERPVMDLEAPKGYYWDVSGMGDSGQEWLEYYLDSAPEPVVAVDTETSRVEFLEGGWRLSTHKLIPYSVSLSVAPRTAAIFKAGDRHLVDSLGQWINRHRALVLFHNEPFDSPVLRELGLEYGYRFTDTMMEAYHIGLPQSLKALAWRLCAMPMDEFGDVARPHSLERVRAWVREILEPVSSADVDSVDLTLGQCLTNAVPYVLPEEIGGGEWLTLIEGVRRSSVRKLIREWVKGFGIDLTPYKGMAVVNDRHPEAALEFASLISRAKHGWEPTVRKLERLHKGLEEGLDDPWTRWGESWTSEDREWCIRQSGAPMPPMDIAWVPWEAVVAYSGADADATLLIWPEIRSLAARFRRSLWV